MSPSSNTAVTIRNLVKVYQGRKSGPVRALDGLTLEVKKGEIFGLLGRNGAGKTTLLRILTTLVQPTSGEASVMGFDVRTDGLAIRHSICAVLQENAVELFLSVQDNLDTYARFHGMGRAERKSRTEEMLDRFGLTEVRSQQVIDLSGGMKRRVQVAKVFMIDKPVVFLDEATTGMDPVNKRATLDAVREEARKGRTIFLTTHILQEAEELCDTIAIIDRGRIVAHGDLQTLKALSSRAYDMTITFEPLDDAVLADLRRLPTLKLTVKGSTADLTIRGEELSALDLLRDLSSRHTISRFEVSGATLEDVFLELLTGPARDRDTTGDPP